MINLLKTPSSPEFLAAYGQLVLPVPNGEDSGVHDAQLTLNSGAPRFWSMEADYREPKVSSLSRHVQCSQCFASASGKPWWIVLAPPQQDLTPPSPSLIKLFRIEPGEILKLHVGTWHAGPYFQDPRHTFFLLEMMDTNSHDLSEVLLPEPVIFDLYIPD